VKLFFLLLTLSTPAYASTFTVMLNPAGDAQSTGRTIDCTFERGITLQCAEYLKKKIESRYSHVRIVLTRIPGETLQPLQNASFANQLDIDLYVSIHFYPAQQDERPAADLYYFSLNPIAESWKVQESALSFIPSHKAHMLNFSTTKTMARSVHATLSLLHKQNCDVHEPLGIPFLPLSGIIAPALGIEMSLEKSSDWQSWVSFLYDAIEAAFSLVEQKKKQKATHNE